MTKRPADDSARIKGWLQRLPTYNFSTPFGAALLPRASVHKLKTVCRLVGIRDDGFLERNDFLQALETREGLNRPLLKECQALGIETEGLRGRANILGALREHAAGCAAADESRCPICLHPYEDGDVIRTLLCSTESNFHEFHADCIDTWAQEDFRESGTMPRCPMCRESIRHTDGVTQRRRLSAGTSSRFATA
jgi:hypothetical protein